MLRITLVLFSVSLLALNAVSMFAQSEKSTSKRPAIDEAAPKEFETATLALG